MSATNNGFEVGPYHFALCREILGELDGSTSEAWDLPEDGWLADMWEYAEAYYDIVDKEFLKHGELPGVATYELSGDLATIFVAKSPKEPMSLEDFKKSTQVLVNSWMREAGYGAENSDSEMSI